ncbi:MAG: hypothetical protein LBF93_09635 [Zoogloeaceae bacterium]|jgi:transposase InsO family protein|nr:hypothetical protein [Zoogloeaceae bacterium]
MDSPPCPADVPRCLFILSGGRRLFHSDRGSQRASGAPGKTLAARGSAPGMSRRSNCRDNAMAGTFLARLRDEEATGVHENKAAARPASPARYRSVKIVVAWIQATQSARNFF